MESSAFDGIILSDREYLVHSYHDVFRASVPIMTLARAPARGTVAARFPNAVLLRCSCLHCHCLQVSSAVYRKYSTDSVVMKAVATAARRGLSRSEFVLLLRWRRGERLRSAASSAIGNCRIRGNISRKGTRISGGGLALDGACPSVGVGKLPVARASQRVPGRVVMAVSDIPVVCASVATTFALNLTPCISATMNFKLHPWRRGTIPGPRRVRSRRSRTNLQSADVPEPCGGRTGAPHGVHGSREAHPVVDCSGASHGALRLAREGEA